ncbi:MAG: hypothetical protein ACQET5_05395 [Halobacteriota archaeon]
MATESPTHVLDEDWDNLLILDGCRYDTFADNVRVEGVLESRVSLGSQSWEFLRENFENERAHDTVYVSANPFTARLDPDIFHAVADLLEKWDETLQTVRPEVVADAACDAIDRFPDKRLIVHFMQPHYPFIGPKGRELDVRGYNPDQDDFELEAPSVWEILRDRRDGYEEITLPAVRAAYTENLHVVLPHVKRLLEELPGRSVVTADHGNLLGERLYPIPVREYGHPRGLYSPPLVRVPWFVVDGDRRELVAEAPIERNDMATGLVERRLAALGYKESF